MVIGRLTDIGITSNGGRVYQARAMEELIKMKARERESLRKSYAELRDRLVLALENAECEVDVAGDEMDKLQGAYLVTIQNKLAILNLKKLRAVERAIEQIDSGEFGDCEECNSDISFKRLEAIPGVTLCISCAEKAELQR